MELSRLSPFLAQLFSERLIFSSHGRSEDLVLQGKIANRGSDSVTKVAPSNDCRLELLCSQAAQSHTSIASGAAAAALSWLELGTIGRRKP